MGPPITIRPAEPADVALIFSLIVELAEYERAAEERSAEALVAELGGHPVGFAVFHGSFSTWECRPGLWLEDLYVPPEHRRAGVGAALLSALAAIAIERGCARLEWAALDWNQPALAFYEKLGARRLGEWVVHRLEGETLERVADARSAGRG